MRGGVYRDGREHCRHEEIKEIPFESKADSPQDKGKSAALIEHQVIRSNCTKLDQHTARSQDTQTLRSRHRCRFRVSAQFHQILVRDFPICASKRIRSGADTDATKASLA